MDRDEKRRSFNLYILLKDSRCDVREEMQKGAGVIASTSSDADMGSTSVSPEERHIGGPKPSRNFFSHKHGLPSQDGTVALYVNKSPHLMLTVDDVSRYFALPDLHGALADYYSGKSHDQRRGQRLSLSVNPLPFDTLQVWFGFKIQHKSSQDLSITNPPQTAQCLPPGPKMPHGHCNTFIVSQDIDPASGQSKLQILFTVHSEPIECRLHHNAGPNHLQAGHHAQSQYSLSVLR
jgi:hypothetical protein